MKSVENSIRIIVLSNDPSWPMTKSMETYFISKKLKILIWDILVSKNMFKIVFLRINFRDI